MINETKKQDVPPYIGFTTFLSFIKGLAETGIPSRIDKSLLRNMSGSNQSALISALKWFDLIDDAGAHGEDLERLVKAGDDAGSELRSLLPRAYKFMADGSIDLARATGAQMQEKFRDYGLSGETIIKAMSFFLAACKEAGIPVSAHVKLPRAPRPNGGARAKKVTRVVSEDGQKEQRDQDEFEDDDVERFEIPVPGKSSVRVIVPRDLDADDWEMLQSMITVYIKRWKGFKSTGGSS